MPPNQNVKRIAMAAVLAYGAVALGRLAAPPATMVQRPVPLPIRAPARVPIDPLPATGGDDCDAVRDTQWPQQTGQ